MLSKVTLSGGASLDKARMALDGSEGGPEVASGGGSAAAMA